MTTRKLLNILKICEDYKTGGINWAWFGRKTTDQPQKELLYIHVDYPDIDFCMRTKTYISYDTEQRLLYVSDNLKMAPNHWLSTLIDDIKNSRVNIEKYYVNSGVNNG